jgi:prepilin-type N-terminal cleavage/methylation domain-containing protein
MTRKNGFTLIELLVVIAIIAILAAIIFPVFMKAKESAYKAGDMSNMNAIRNALQLYRMDQDAYPPQLLGYASFYSSGPQTGQLIPASALRQNLYPKRIDAISGLQPAYDRNVSGTDTINTVVWPNPDSRAVGSAPEKDLNGDGSIDGTDDIASARQVYGLTNTVAAVPPYVAGGSVPAAVFYQVSGFDAARVKVAPAGTPDRWELRYFLRWSSYAMGGGNRQDDPRQLIYSDPPDDTVITWDSWFRDYTTGNLPTHDRKDFVLYLNGQARSYDSAIVANRSWRLLP